MKVLGYLGAHKAAVVVCVLLLVGAVFCDLALPNLTSNIVDVGIQQSGVEHVATDELTAGTYQTIRDYLSRDDRALFEDAYVPAGQDRYALTENGRAHIGQLDAIMTAPLAEAYGLSSGADDPLVAQSAIAAALREYAALGYDLSAMQMRYLIATGAAMLGLAACSMVLNVAVGLVASRTGAGIGRDLRRRLFSKVVRFSDAEIGRFSAASLITRGTNDIQLIQMVSIMLLRMVLYAPLIAIGGIIMVLATNAALGWIIVVAIVAVALVIGVLFRFTLPKFKIMQKLIDKVNLIAREMLSGIAVVRAFDRQAFEQQRFDSASTELMRTQLFTNRAMSFMMPAMMLIMNLTSVAIVWFGGLLVGEGTLQTGDLIAFITYSMVIIMGFLMIGMVSIMLPRADVAAGRINEVLACEPSIEDPEKPQTAPRAEGARPRGVDGVAGGVGLSVRGPAGARIEFRAVSFRYDETSEYALRDVSFTAEPGTTLAIVGPTGSGKSTIMKLAERFYDVTEGAVLVDGVDVRDMRQADVRATFGYVPQKAFLFSGTIDSNVAYVDEGMPEARVQRALQVAQASAFVDARAEGVEAPISQGGTNVSGGQRQRLAIARALATDARAFLFDDSFSALDYKTDAQVRAALREQVEGVTCIIVAQRIATVMTAERIVVLDEGRVVGQGTHEQLMRTCSEYREIALSQLSETELGLSGDAA